MNLAQRYPVTLKKGQLEWLVDPFDSCFMNIHTKMCYIDSATVHRRMHLCVWICAFVYIRCYMRMMHISMYAGTNVYIYIYTRMVFSIHSIS